MEHEYKEKNRKKTETMKQRWGKERNKKYTKTLFKHILSNEHSTASHFNEKIRLYTMLATRNEQNKKKSIFDL